MGGGPRWQEYAKALQESDRPIFLNQRLPLKFYYRTANGLLKQAAVYRYEQNLPELYVMLMRFANMVADTISKHDDYNSAGYSKEKVDFRKILLKEVLPELERLKPDLKRKMEELKNEERRLKSWPGQRPERRDPYAWPPVALDSSTDDDPPIYLPSPPPNGRPAGAYVSRPPSGQMDLLTGTVPSYTGYSASTSTSYAPNYASFTPSYSSMSTSTSYSSYLPAREETLSRHSFLGLPAQRQRPHHEVLPQKVSYPSAIDSSPVTVPDLLNLRLEERPSSSGSSTPSVMELQQPKPALPLDMAPEVPLTPQPSPPPVDVPVQRLQIAQPVDSPQPSPHDVADPRPGPPVEFDDLKGPKPVHFSHRILEEFLRVAQANTRKNLETCAVLAGTLSRGVFTISTLVVPKQEATSDSCSTINEEEIFEAQDARGLFQLGWIHTHPTQTCFMSSIDLHTHYSYQVMSPEAIAIVCAPTDSQRKYGVFRLSDPGGLKVVGNCQRRGFHPHDNPPDGSPIYEQAGHVKMDAQLGVEVLDLR